MIIKTIERYAYHRPSRKVSFVRIAHPANKVVGKLGKIDWQRPDSDGDLGKTWQCGMEHDADED